ncbi:MAG: GNAT family N-acetyltransferase [Ardenticatenaceae bacterium]|nr:GNAT family N-acetyltransferase [Ardenticatenaceae bacterium]
MPIIRRASTHDIPAILPLWVEFITFHADRDSFFEQDYPSLTHHYQQFLEKALASDAWLVVVAEGEKGALAGYCVATSENRWSAEYGGHHYGFVEDMAVAAAYRRQGVAQALYDVVEAWFQQQNVDHIELNIAVANEVSRAFWERQGFRSLIIRMIKREE